MEYEYLPMLCNRSDLLSNAETQPFSKANTNMVMKKKISKMKIKDLSTSAKQIKMTTIIKHNGSKTLKVSCLNIDFLLDRYLYKL